MATVLPGIAPGADSPGNGRTELKSGWLNSAYLRCVRQLLLPSFLLAAVLREALERRGVMGEMKARMRAEVFKALDDQVLSLPACTGYVSPYGMAAHDVIYEANVLENFIGRPF